MCLRTWKGMEDSDQKLEIWDQKYFDLRNSSSPVCVIG